MSRRFVTEAERALWSRATRDVSPLSRPLGHVAHPAPQASRGEPIVAHGRAHPALAVQRRKNSHLVVGGGDPRMDRMAGTKRMPIERTLDLHGMTQVEAHRELMRFVAASAAAGVRTALVITGKGRRDAAGGGGVLRMRFLDWIEESPLRAAVARVSPAKAKDGGAGAFYIFFKGKARSEAPHF